MLAAIFVAALLPCRAPAAAGPQLMVRDRYLAGPELRILADTARSRSRFLRGGTDVVEARGWLITIDLSQEGPLSDRARVIGPLWSTDKAQSDLSFQIGVQFTAEDAAAGKARPPMGFDDHGALVRQVRTPEGALIVEACSIADGSASWAKVSDASPVGRSGKDWVEGRLRNEHARTLVQEEADGKTRAYDLFTGAPMPDEWLIHSFADLRGRADFHNTVTWLTDDLNYIAARPEAMHNDSGRIYENFLLDGRTYSRAEYGLIYTRPSPVPVLFRKPPNDAGFLMEPPHGAYSVDGELLLLEVGEGTLRLFTPDGTTRFEWTKHDQPTWEAGNVPDRQIDPAAARLVLYGLRDPDDRKYGDEHVILVVWDYKAGTLRRETLELSDLFDVKDNAYVPKGRPE